MKRRKERSFVTFSLSIYMMEIHIFLKGKNEPTIFKGDRIDILDIDLQGKKYKQVRYFRKGVSKSQYICVDLIKNIKEVIK